MTKEKTYVPKMVTSYLMISYLIGTKKVWGVSTGNISRAFMHSDALMGITG